MFDEKLLHGVKLMVSVRDFECVQVSMQVRMSPQALILLSLWRCLDLCWATIGLPDSPDQTKRAAPRQRFKIHCGSLVESVWNCFFLWRAEPANRETPGESNSRHQLLTPSNHEHTARYRRWRPLQAAKYEDKMVMDKLNVSKQPLDLSWRKARELFRKF